MFELYPREDATFGCKVTDSIFNSDFEPSIMIHMLNAWPSVLARKSLHARENLLIPAFEKYFTENSHHQGSLLV
jgi:hypothetical protein